MLFSKDYQDLPSQDADIRYYPVFFNKEHADFLFKHLINDIELQQDTIKLFGKIHLQPRLNALFANNNIPYSYSSITMHPKEFSIELLQIKKSIEDVAGIHFTSCLANLYRNGQDSNGWHTDNEKELGKNPFIASVSFGSERIFKLKHRTNLYYKQNILLKHGSLLIMKGRTQECWLHQIPKTKKIIGERINLTYRVIK